ncbi:prolipoprotein diacylglyceryl transferase family protein [Granulicella arctica]|uniref:Phosphatidylglycerol:prolipoprotein diacylglycerol transferase n=1 Tax=Granulicella arctica TaxID=940613 RepID=A0A7Y9TGS4_9BACT|nr:phosphatidylglycerol:prolipoprotein diacylglycerol transferase [Granulicella arctica]
MHSSFLHLGSLHVPLYGICAAVGLMGALTLCQVTARLVRLDAMKVWDALWVIALAVFVISRALLVMGSFHSFLTSPMLVLSLPSLNDTGMLLTAVFAMIYLRYKRVPLLGFLDAMAPCAALLWAFLSLGSILEGTKDGMPTHFLFAVGDGAGQGVHPVEFYTLIVGIVLCGVLLRALPRLRHTGFGCALGLVLAGAAIFLLDFLRLPSELFVAAMLDPVQWLGLAMIFVGCALFIAFPEMPTAAARNGSSDSV